MAKTVMIPSSETETWICRINHKEYSYPQGTTQTVPDEVAELIEAIYASEEEPATVDKSKWAVYSQGGWNEVPSGLPDASEASNGDVLTIEAGEPAWKAPSGGGGGGGSGATIVEPDLAHPEEITIATPKSASDEKGGGTKDGDEGVTYTCYPLIIKGTSTNVSYNDIAANPDVILNLDSRAMGDGGEKAVSENTRDAGDPVVFFVCNLTVYADYSETPAAARFDGYVYEVLFGMVQADHIIPMPFYGATASGKLYMFTGGEDPK